MSSGERMEEPPRPRATVTDEGGVMRVVIPARRHWFVTIFLTGWLGCWAVGEVAALRAVFTSAPRLGVIFLSFWMVAWTAAGAFAFWFWLWSVRGREVIILDGTAFTVRRESPIYARVQMFDQTRVKDLRIAPRPMAWQGYGGGAASGAGVGPIAFDYGAKTYQFGSGVDEAEAKELVAAMHTRFPSLGSERSQ